MHFAARQGSAPIAKLLLDHGAEIDPLEARGYNPMLVAAALQQWDVGKYLMDRGADTSCKDDGQLGGKTALEHMPRLNDKEEL